MDLMNPFFFYLSGISNGYSSLRYDTRIDTTSLPPNLVPPGSVKNKMSFNQTSSGIKKNYIIY